MKKASSIEIQRYLLARSTRSSSGPWEHSVFTLYASTSDPVRSLTDLNSLAVKHLSLLPDSSKAFVSTLPQVKPRTVVWKIAKGKWSGNSKSYCVQGAL